MPATYEQLAGNGALMGLCLVSLLWGIFVALPLAVGYMAAPRMRRQGNKGPTSVSPVAAACAATLWFISGPLAVSVLRSMFGFASPAAECASLFALLASGVAVGLGGRWAGHVLAGKMPATRAIDEEGAVVSAVPGGPPRVTLGCVLSVVPVALIAVSFSAAHGAQVVRSGSVFVSYWSDRRSVQALKSRKAATALFFLIGTAAAAALAAVTLAPRIGFLRCVRRLGRHGSQKVAWFAGCAITFSLACGSVSHFLGSPGSVFAQGLVVFAFLAAAVTVTVAAVVFKRPLGPSEVHAAGHNNIELEEQRSPMLDNRGASSIAAPIRRRPVHGSASRTSDTDSSGSSGVNRTGDAADASTVHVSHNSNHISHPIDDEEDRNFGQGEENGEKDATVASECENPRAPSRARLLAAFLIVTLASVPMILLVKGMGDACFAIHPNEFSTPLTRLLFSRQSSGAGCEKGAICHTYATLGADGGRFVMYGHLRHDSARNTTHAGFAEFFEISREDLERKQVLAGDDPCAVATAPSVTNREALLFEHVENIRDERRIVLYGEISVRPGRVHYCARVGYAPVDTEKDNGAAVTSSYRVLRSLPSANTTVRIIAGGDMQVPRDIDSPTSFGLLASKGVSLADPDFAIVGGDIAYGNGLSTCFRRWDTWFKTWDAHAGRGGKWYLPLTATPGNHEAGGFGMERSNLPFYLRYFAQGKGSTNGEFPPVEPQAQEMYHTHRVADFLQVVSLDSDVVEKVSPDAPQTKWLEDTLRTTDDWATTRLVFYHYPGWPSVPRWAGTRTVNIRDSWAPLFASHNVDVVFEHHYHVYKRTAPIGGDGRPTDDPGDGFVVMGDGSWGVESHYIPAEKSDLVEKVERVKAVFLVEAAPGGQVNMTVINDAGEAIDTVVSPRWEGGKV